VIVSLLAAVSENGGIGKDDRLPWHLRADLQRFKRLTMGHHLIMGRKTYESIGRRLPGREMIILSRQRSFHTEGCFQAKTFFQALELAREHGETEVFVIGGEAVFHQALPFAEKMYLTRVHATIDADTFFPQIDADQWELIWEEAHPADEDNDFAYTFQEWVRRSA
jgi:dihydrofolate reductase